MLYSNDSTKPHAAIVPTELKIKNLAEKLQAVHGPVQIRREANGIQLYMACPKCLQEYGRRELKSRHLAVNAEKFLGLGKFALNFLPGNREKSRGYAQCMKEHGSFTVRELLAYPTLESRGIDNLSPMLSMRGLEGRYLVPDGKGNMIPDQPGSVIPVTSLPSNHPAIQYLQSRDYEPALLYRQFRASWCTKEAPEGDEYGGRWYRRHSQGFKSTPQGRIIFYSDVAGIQVCWQGRYVEMEHEGKRYIWHPYDEQWILRPDWPKGEEPIKYNTATGAFRNAQLCGYDAVRDAAAVRCEPNGATCVLTEGPLDAARFPGHGLAVLGKSLSDTQILLLQMKFKKVILAFDTDSFGCEAAIKAHEDLTRNGLRVLDFFTPEERAEGRREGGQKVDAGMLGYVECNDRLQRLLAEFRNQDEQRNY